MANLRVVELKAFVPARDFELSKRFYRDIGFTMAAFDNENATGSDADTRTLAKNAKAFSKALCEAAVNGTR